MIVHLLREQDHAGSIPAARTNAGRERLVTPAVQQTVVRRRLISVVTEFDSRRLDCPSRVERVNHVLDKHAAPGSLPGPPTIRTSGGTGRRPGLRSR